tara:strand:+ start:55 stop:1038 length:984 start_codon:yes stop_codon:yes gene_type:complete
MLKKRKIIFRADANALIGMGHYTRLVALAEILKGHFKCVFAMISPSDFVKADLIENGFSLINLTSDEDLFLKLEGFDIVVLDGYGFTESFQIEIKKLVKKLVCIDDLCEQKYYSDVIINHANGVIESSFKALRKTKICLGHDYLILRECFYNVSDLKPKREYDVFICFGGSDNDNWTKYFLKICKDIDPFMKIVVVVGDSYQKFEALRQFISQKTNIKLFKNLKANQMMEVLCDSKVAICPSSNMAFEALASGCKLVLGKSADNQKFIYKGLKKLEGVFSIGNLCFSKEFQHYEAIEHAISHNLKQKFRLNASSKNLLDLFLNLSND